MLKKCAGVRRLGARLGTPTRLGRCKAKPAKELLLVAWVTVTGMPDCKERIAVEGPAAEELSARPVEAKRWPCAGGQIVDAADGGDIGHVAAGDVSLEPGAKGVCRDEAAGIGRGEHGG